MQRGLVLSDLHLFSPRSIASELLEEHMERLLKADVLVLNGDIFDFRWSTLRDHPATISAAIDWLSCLLDGFQGAAVHYLLGNHDCLAAFHKHLDERFADHPKIHIHEHRLLLRRNLFLHGDCANHRMDGKKLAGYRLAWSDHGRKGATGRLLYRIADAGGFTRRFHDAHFPRQATVERVAHHLNDVMPSWRSDIDHCFFGHTHRPFVKHRHEGVDFHNTGSGIRGMGFLPLDFEA